MKNERVQVPIRVLLKFLTMIIVVPKLTFGSELRYGAKLYGWFGTTVWKARYATVRCVTVR